MTDVASIGNILKDARTRKAVSLEDVHIKIKIHPRVLQLLEENKFEKLPSPLFVKSFLKSYAEFLEINPGELLEAYEKEPRKEPEQGLFIKPQELLEKINRRESPNKKFLILPLLLIGAAALLLALFFVLKTAGSALALHKPFVFRQTQSLPKFKTTSSPEAPEGSHHQSADWIRSVAQGNFPSLDKNTRLQIKVKALDNVWLRVTCDGKVLFQSILKRGASEEWNARSAIEIWTGNSSNMILSLNGYSLGSPGRGVVKKLTVTHQGVKIAS